MKLLTQILGIFRKDFVVGLDLGSSSIKLVELARREDGLALIRADAKEITHLEDPLAREKAFLAALKELLKGVVTRRSKFIVSVNCPRTGVRVITTPPMPKAELREAIRLESKNYFPFPIEESQLEFEVLGQISEKGARKVQLAVAASPRGTIDATISLLKKAGIKPASVIPVPCALQKLAQASQRGENQVQCLLDVGERQSELVILRGKYLIFSRKIPVGGRDFTQAMTGVLVSDRGKTQLSWEEAETIKREVGFPLAEGSRMIGEKVSASELVSMLRSPLEQLTSEIDRCFDYYREESGGGRIDALLLFGRGAAMKGFCESLSEGLGIEVRVGDPLELLKLPAQLVRPEQGFSQFAVALGAALSGGEGINLLPPEIKEERQRIFTRATVQSLAAAALLLTAFAYIGMRIQLSNYQKRIDVAKLELSSLRFDLEKAAARNFANQVLATEPYWEDVFKELSNVLPREAYLTRLEMKDRKLVFKGVITSVEKQAVLNGLIQSLENGIFKNVKLVTAKETSDKTGTEFELNAWVD